MLLGSGLAATESNSTWFWLLPLFVVGAVTVWTLASGELNRRPSTDSEISNGSTDKTAALDTLKHQYAVGEISDTEFERRIETLLEIDDATDRLDIDPGTAGATANRENRSKGERNGGKQDDPSGRRAQNGRHRCHRSGKPRHGTHPRRRR
ncbi:hypothetical protein CHINAEXTREME_11585 [Halobiforma lacisalsi AJ5]|uniref:SHOCT domain-containing protein n=1 Tax=Natronobacterium lacisalsi AJ5 TaxID=358396 RepID=M0L6E8_NATLA|nr:hypothetical protein CHINAEXTREME_11585 [Halobiforma lacisalsi AJ5]EMA27994.1 hypothetical protein C445_20132 [Halobiforma lacisalsi AJ5]